MSIKAEGGWFVDDHGNKWGMDKFHHDEAERLSMTLINCSGCINCRCCQDCADCTDCTFCNNCKNCVDCHNCNDCEDCSCCNTCFSCRLSTTLVNCSRCTETYGCSYSSWLNDCRDCTYCYSCNNCCDCFRCCNCSRCTNCAECEGINDFRDNPERVVGPYCSDIENNVTIYWLGSEREQVSYSAGDVSVMDLRRDVDGMKAKAVANKYIKFLEAFDEYKKTLGK